MSVESPRITPGGWREIGIANFGLAWLLGLATGGAPPNVFTTVARHRKLFRRWLRFAGALMPGGVLGRADAELVILRVADNCGCEYESRHHERLARAAGLSPQEIASVSLAPSAGVFSPRQALLLRSADELHAARTISPELWSELRSELSEIELIELCMLVGHYEMLAMTLNALAVAPDPLPTEPSTAVRLAYGLLNRRRAAGGHRA